MTFYYFISVSFFIISILYIFQIKKYTSHKISTPKQALDQLIQGNKKYNSFWNFLKKANRKSVATMQKPFAIILSCSDSRVPTEIIFNQLNVGSLFIVRNAGHVLDGAVLGSIEYGVDQLKALLIIVLGHERCGAVTATVDSILSCSPEQLGHIKTVINAISPAAHIILNKHAIKKPITDETIKTDIVNQVVKENINIIINSMYKKSEIIASAAQSEQINIVGAYYDLNDGKVEILDLHP